MLLCCYYAALTVRWVHIFQYVNTSLMRVLTLMHVLNEIYVPEVRSGDGDGGSTGGTTPSGGDRVNKGRVGDQVAVGLG